MMIFMKQYVMIYGIKCFFRPINTPQTNNLLSIAFLNIFNKGSLLHEQERNFFEIQTVFYIELSAYLRIS